MAEIKSCRIKIGKNAKNPLRYMASIREVIDPWAVRCERCKQEWECGPLADVGTITCSNCYSDNVYLVQVRVTPNEDICPSGDAK